MVLSLEPSLGAATYVGRLSMVSTFPDGVPSWTLPERQQELIPTLVDIVKICKGVNTSEIVNNS